MRITESRIRALVREALRGDGITAQAIPHIFELANLYNLALLRRRSLDQSVFEAIAAAKVAADQNEDLIVQHMMGDEEPEL